MKTGFYALLTCAVLAGLYLAKIKEQNPPIFYAIAVIMVIAFIWGLYSRSKKAAKRKYRENMFRQHMRMTLRNQWH